MARTKNDPEETTNERIIQVTERPMERDESVLPDEIVDHFKALGFRVLLASRNENNVTRLAGYGQHPVHLDDLSEELRTAPRMLRRFGIFLDPSGFLYKGDCFLFQQSVDNQEYYAQEARRSWDQQNENAASEDQGAMLTDMIARGVNAAGKGGGRQLAHVEVKHATRLDEYGARV
jgi:hypothetical protein